MKTLFAALSLLLLAGCVMPTKQPLDSAVMPVPPERLLAYQTGGDATIVVTRDIGMIGGGCYLGLLIDKTLAAKLDPGERASFSVSSGEHLVAPSWIEGKGLCGAFYSAERAEARRRATEITLKPGETKRYRIHTSTDGESTLEPVM